LNVRAHVDAYRDLILVVAGGWMPRLAARPQPASPPTGRMAVTCECGLPLDDRLEVEEGQWLRPCPCGRMWLEKGDGMVELVGW
jgi:hypothetical protein